jgi:predicted TIM-barrel fold metal-dependent hydrolase
LRVLPLAGLVALATAASSSAQTIGKPIIDMHMHAWSLVAEFGPNPVPKACIGADGAEMNPIDPAQPFDFAKLVECRHRAAPSRDDAALLADTLRVMDRYNIVAGVISGDGPVVANWRAVAPDRFIPGANFFVDEGRPPLSRVAELEAAVKAGKIAAFAEITAQYRGLSPDDPSLEPFYAMAERLDVPVGIHMGYGAPGGPYWLYPKYRAALGNPLLLEELLVRHPRMRVYVMHAGMPMVDEIIMLMNAHPQVYVDISADNWAVPRKEFHFILKRLVDAGYGRRIMFGSDQMAWTDVVPVAIASITEAPFLSEHQKRDILYNNAARFLRLPQDVIDKHHGKSAKK